MRPTHKYSQSDTIVEANENKSRLNLNDLLQRKEEQEKRDKKNNLLIFSGTAVLAVTIVAILAL